MSQNIIEVPIWHKALLTPAEMSAYTGLDIKVTRKMLKDPYSTFTYKSESRLYANRELLDEYLKENVLT